MSRSTSSPLIVVAREAALVSAGIVAVGRVIEGPLHGFDREDDLNRWCLRRRTPLLNRLTWIPSTYADTPATIGMSLVLGAAGYRATRSWQRAAAPLAAITLETVVFVATSHVVGRARPDVPWLDRPAPTPSFPSGHTGATTAMHLVVADTLAGLGRPRAARVLRLSLPALVGVSRVYRGMHHPSDVVVGIALGAWASRAVRLLLPGDR